MVAAAARKAAAVQDTGAAASTSNSGSSSPDAVVELRGVVSASLSLDLQRHASVISSVTSASSGSTDTLDKPFEATMLNLEAVASTLRDPVIFSQCLLLLLEQAVLSAVTVVLPAAMNTPTWVVGLMYLPLVRSRQAAALCVLLWQIATPCAAWEQ
jgi:hypothetical protein